MITVTAFTSCSQRLLTCSADMAAAAADPRHRPPTGERRGWGGGRHAAHARHRSGSAHARWWRGGGEELAGKAHAPRTDAACTPFLENYNSRRAPRADYGSREAAGRGRGRRSVSRAGGGGGAGNAAVVCVCVWWGMSRGRERVVALVDMDCFFMQVEQRLDPQLRGRPCAVVQYTEWQGGG